METIQLAIQNNVAILTINRPQALNALSTQVLKDMDKALDEVENNSDIYVLIVTGSGEKAFVAGADIAEMKDKNVADAAIYGAYGNQIFRRIETLKIPVIAAIQGFALGGGCELAMCCDIRIASDQAVFGQPEVGLGITPGFGGTQRLARLVGEGIAKEMIFTARNIKADRALAIGLINQVVASDQVEAVALQMAHTICKNAPIAVANAKAAINKGMQCDIDKGIAIEVEEFSKCFASEDQKYGMNCFLEKRKEKTFSNK